MAVPFLFLSLDDMEALLFFFFGLLAAPMAYGVPRLGELGIES